MTDVMADTSLVDSVSLTKLISPYPQKMQQYLLFLVMGMTEKSAAEQLGATYKNVWDWGYRYPGYKDAIQDALSMAGDISRVQEAQHLLILPYGATVLMQVSEMATKPWEDVKDKMTMQAKLRCIDIVKDALGLAKPPVKNTQPQGNWALIIAQIINQNKETEEDFIVSD